MITYTKFISAAVSSGIPGHVLLISLLVNWAAGLCSLICLLFLKNLIHIEWLHVVLFLGMPLVGFVWFLRDTYLSHSKFRQIVDGIFQLFPALFPWFVLVENNVL